MINKISKGTAGLLILPLIIFFSRTAFAQDEKITYDVFELGEVVVTGERGRVESIGTVREVTAEDIRNKGARTLDEALELLPGLDIRVGGQGVPRVNLRGFRSRHVLLLLNGIPFNSVYDGQFDPSIIPVENIAKIKVSYGNHSVLYGQSGLGGAINIITKKGKKGIRGKVLGEAGERDRYLSRFSLSGGKKNINFFLSGSHFKQDGFILSDDFESTSEEDGGLRKNSANRRKNFFANAGIDLSQDWRIGLVFNYLQGEYGTPPGTINDKKDPFAKTPKYERVEDFEGFSGQITTSYDLPGPLDLRAWIFTNHFDQKKNRYDDNNYNSMSDPTVKGTYDKNSETEITGGNIQTRCDLESAGLFTLGLSAEWQDFESEGRIRDIKLPKKKYGVGNFSTDRDVDVYNASIEYELSPLENLGIVLGYGHHWFEKEDDKNDDESSFLVGAHYDIFEDTKIRGSVARKIRFPSIKQLYEEDTGNPGLTAEKSKNYELGIEQRLPWKTTISLTGFLMDVEDYIEKDSSTEIYQNHDEYRFQGFELTAETRFYKNLILRAGYTFLDTDDRSTGTEIEELEHRPKNKITFEAKYSFGFGFSTYMNVMHVSDQYHYSEKSPLIKKKLNDYTLVNLKLEQGLFDDRFCLYFGVDNLFDEDYEESYGFPLAGRTIYGGLEFQF